MAEDRNPIGWLNLATSTLSSTLRGWRGTFSPANEPELDGSLVLFDRENDPECRLLRESLTETGFDVLIKPVPEGGTRYLQELQEISGGTRLPVIYNPADGHHAYGVDAARKYLRQLSGRQRRDTASSSSSALSSFKRSVQRAGSQGATWLRGKKGLVVRPSRRADKPLILYSFESSPYSRPVRERLCEFQLSYRLVNLGKQQLADLGPAVRRLHLGSYQPLPGSRREQLLKRYGRVQVPLLEDPNTGKTVFESQRILDYLEATYASL